ncbi:hypothetical protein DJ93_5644 [Bacillus clarus]|uniref:Uncharacterized protein n=1 Tax=Bacillus clarus TaxID=2338372 RepID=A0A090Y9J8_9BACI|nr:hypothetical protein DJ93_5644 [Bacillus clarus]
MLAREREVTLSNLSNIENGRYKHSYKMRKRLCQLLGQIAYFRTGFRNISNLGS